ncbi:MAG TPA: response regulator [Planctomycetota bacterium]|nr:response regulator [Planctomycetota bacterium]
MQQSFRVLLVEDDDSLRCCLWEFLASHGWEVGATAFGNEAMDMARRHRFDFSILDFHLPGTTGLQLFQQLASIRPMPAILMSGLASTDEARAAHHAGFFSFLRKPLELEHLRRSVQQLIQTHFGGPVTTPGTWPLPGWPQPHRRPDQPPAPPPQR